MIVGPPVQGEDCYSFASDLPTGAAITRRWSYKGAWRSVLQRGGGIVKTREAFPDQVTVADMTALLAEASARGVTRPSGYGDLFHQLCRTPRARAAHVKLFPQIPGGWNSVLGSQIVVRDPLYRYDIRSAYLWALSEGLPDPKTFRTVRRVDGPGVYWCESPCHPMLPHPWNKPGMHPATFEELELMPIRVRDIRRGVAFVQGSFDVGPWLDSIQSWSCGKAVARAFWGRWIATGKVRQETFDPAGEVRTSRELPDVARQPIWAAIITARLRMRLWGLVDSGERTIYRVQTDSIITDTPIDTGERLGEWKLEATFPTGGKILPVGVVPY